MWHKFSEEQPKKQERCLTITKSSIEKKKYCCIMELIYYPSTGVFNWDGVGEDTEIKVLYWAYIKDILPEELREEQK